VPGATDRLSLCQWSAISVPPEVVGVDELGAVDLAVGLQGGFVPGGQLHPVGGGDEPVDIADVQLAQANPAGKALQRSIVQVCRTPAPGVSMGTGAPGIGLHAERQVEIMTGGASRVQQSGVWPG